VPASPSSVAAALSDHYTIEHELGRGGMATVYLALMLHEIPPRPERTEEIRAANLGLPLPVEA